ncbi:hypothetical protein HPT25_16850 [Bacillus sp. BRMEA1]|uniref:CBO0543 family protein n=1 Tax=Neobacillus endophyticus TaxID=2738405 RepID=UPI00156690ED|nr:CBO0543 family protein [Neobacillus endophyticus]NRD79031.1 hypothetical protein [Neobacillus endophyticus]
MSKSFPSYENVQKVREKLKDIAYQHWINDDFLTWKWWLLLILSIVPWIIWWKIVDKKRIIEILLYGTFIVILCMILDNLGTDLIWWGYPHKLFQSFPPLVPADITLVPCLMMLVYQWTNKWKSFLIMDLILSLLMSYLGEPFFIWLNFYQLTKWKLFYSFLFYNFSGIFCRWIVLKLKLLN